jgi:energy-converting hydrogenase Eha subunit H
MACPFGLITFQKSAEELNASGGNFGSVTLFASLPLVSSLVMLRVNKLTITMFIMTDSHSNNYIKECHVKRPEEN